jgi:hypothetical protein
MPLIRTRGGNPDEEDLLAMRYPVDYDEDEDDP